MVYLRRSHCKVWSLREIWPHAPAASSGFKNAGTFHNNLTSTGSSILILNHDTLQFFGGLTEVATSLSICQRLPATLLSAPFGESLFSPFHRCPESKLRQGRPCNRPQQGTDSLFYKNFGGALLNNFLRHFDNQTFFRITVGRYKLNSISGWCFGRQCASLQAWK